MSVRVNRKRCTRWAWLIFSLSVLLFFSMIAKLHFSIDGVYSPGIFATMASKDQFLVFDNGEIHRISVMEDKNRKELLGTYSYQGGTGKAAIQWNYGDDRIEREVVAYGIFGVTGTRELVHVENGYDYRRHIMASLLR